jgi:DNA-binding XRE family transcriptional regulator
MQQGRIKERRVITRLNAYRKRTKTTADDLAYEIGIHRATLHRWMTGDFLPNRENMEKIERYLKVIGGRK